MLSKLELKRLAEPPPVEFRQFLLMAAIVVGVTAAWAVIALVAWSVQ